LVVAVATAIVETRRRTHSSDSDEPDSPQHSVKDESVRIRQIPSPPADFTGREDELKELLTSIELGGVTISGLQGMGGIGKTVLACKLAELLKPRYPDAQFFLDLKGASTQPLTVAEALAHVVRAYHPADKLPETESELRGLYLSVLDGQRALLLMDNAANAEQVEHLIPPVGCLLLVTSRQHFAVPGLAAKSLDMLTAVDARDLLLTIAPRIETRADEIATLCGHLPLALRLAASAMAKYRNLSPADYVRRLQDRQQRLQLIDASLSLSYELLSEELREHWRWLAVFPDTFADDAAAAVWGVAVDQAKDILGELMAASLVEWNETNNRYHLHDLAGLFADEKLSAEERAVGQKLFATHYTLVLAAANQLYEKGGESLLRGMVLFDLEWGNIQAGHAWVAAAHADAVDADVVLLGMAYPSAGVYVLSLRQHSRERIRWLEIALTAARRLQYRDGESATLGNLGLAYADLGEPLRAIQFYEQALLIDREIGNRRGEGADLGNLGLAYAALGETRRAVQFHEQALLIVREIGDRRYEGNVLGNLGLAYRNLGEISRAIQFYEQHLTIVREIGDRRGEGAALGNLGLASADLGQPLRAVQFHEQALLIDREIGYRRGEGTELGNLGLAYAALGETHRAIRYYEQYLAIARETGDRRGEGHARGNLGIAYKNLGDTHIALQLYEQALFIHRETGDRRAEGTVLWNMSLALDELGERAQAIQNAEQALIIREELEDPRAANVREQLAEWRESGAQPM